jgi:hypothetical protein
VWRRETKGTKRKRENGDPDWSGHDEDGVKQKDLSEFER